MTRADVRSHVFVCDGTIWDESCGDYRRCPGKLPLTGTRDDVETAFHAAGWHTDDPKFGHDTLSPFTADRHICPNDGGHE